MLTARRSEIAVPRLHPLPTLYLGGTAVMLVAGYAAAGSGSFLLVGTLAIVASLAVIAFPETALVIALGAMLASGRVITHLHVGPVYVTDVFLFALLLAVLLRWLRRTDSAAGVRFALLLFVVVSVPAIAGLAFKTDLSNRDWLRNFAIIYYVAFAIVAAFVRPSPRFYRLLFAVTVGASLVAIALVFTGHSGPYQDTTTSTGATRLAHGSYSLPFGIAPLVLIGAVRERLIPRVYFLLVLPFLVGLVLINHRSAWIAFAVALLVLVAARLSASIILLLGAALVAGAFFFSAHSQSQNSTFAQEIHRGRSVASTTDPNARYRLSFWKKLLHAGQSSPLIGLGFNDYPAQLVPARSASDRHPAPHNSYVALFYRIGPAPTGVLLFFVGLLFVRGWRSAATDGNPHYRAVLSVLVAVTTYVGIFSALNVSFELPYSGPLFWSALGLLVGVLHARKKLSLSIA